MSNRHQARVAWILSHPNLYNNISELKNLSARQMAYRHYVQGYSSSAAIPFSHTNSLKLNKLTNSIWRRMYNNPNRLFSFFFNNNQRKAWQKLYAAYNNAKKFKNRKRNNGGGGASRRNALLRAANK